MSTGKQTNIVLEFGVQKTAMSLEKYQVKMREFQFGVPSQLVDLLNHIFLMIRKVNRDSYLHVLLFPSNSTGIDTKLEFPTDRSSSASYHCNEDLLDAEEPHSWTGRNLPTNWHARSPDIAQCDCH